MTPKIETLLTTPVGYRSVQVARFAWQLDEQRRMLTVETRGLSPEELAWQPFPGMNTRGMLLSHIAYAETHLTQVGILGETTGHAHDVIGLTEEEEGLPLASGALPAPATLGRPLEYFDDLLARAREHTLAALRGLTDDDLGRRVTRPRPDGAERVFNVGWVIYHILEHEAGHRGQINLLGHLHRAMRGA